MNFKRISILALFALGACNSVYVKPESLDKSQVFFADRGGYSMRRSIKQRMEQRGYNVIVGTATQTAEMDDTADDAIEIDSDSIPAEVRYRIKVRERRERFRPYWCPFNGFWWWNFNVSIADQLTGEELMTWRGRGCANSSLRKLDRILKQMEIPENDSKDDHKEQTN